MHLSSAVGLIAICAAMCTIVAAAPYQELKPRPGWVPVYIREGETPLSEIHPKLAEAFNEVESLSLTRETNDEDQPVAGKEAVVPPQTQVEDVPPASAEPIEPKTSTESDIASFDVVKGDSDANDKSAADEPKASASANETKTVA